jgi:hypothetical protein
MPPTTDPHFRRETTGIAAPRMGLAPFSVHGEGFRFGSSPHPPPKAHGFWKTAGTSKKLWPFGTAFLGAQHTGIFAVQPSLRLNQRSNHACILHCRRTYGQYKRRQTRFLPLSPQKRKRRLSPIRRRRFRRTVLLLRCTLYYEVDACSPTMGVTTASTSGRTGFLSR